MKCMMYAWCLILAMCLSATLVHDAMAITNFRKKACRDKNNCLHNKTCACYCSRKCGFRDKEEDDKPVYVKDDPNGFYCYCKPWDRDNVGFCLTQEENEVEE
jgi:hypothetical protein